MKSDEEKAAEQAAAEALAQEQAAKAEQERVAAEAAAAQAAATEAAHVATLPKYEYRILFLTAAAGYGDGTIVGLEQQLNELAADGWRVVTTTMSGKIEQAFAMDKNDVYVVLERPARTA